MVMATPPESPLPRRRPPRTAAAPAKPAAGAPSEAPADAPIDLSGHAGTTPEPRNRRTGATPVAAAPEPVRAGEPVPARTRSRASGHTTVLLTQEQHDWLAAGAAESTRSKKSLVLAAVEANQSALKSHFEVTDSLFADPQIPDVPGKKLPFSLELSPHERKVLEDLVSQAGDPSQSHYIRVAIDLQMRNQLPTA